MPRSRPPAGFFAARALATCVAVLLGIGQLFALGHLVFVQHRLCAAHGDVHHAAAGENHKAQVGAPASVSPGDSASADDHEHCDGWVRLDEPPASSCVTLSEALLPRFYPVARVGAAASLSPLALLLVAPKLPPPLS